MKSTHDSTSSLLSARDLVRWHDHLRRLHQRLRPFFARPEPFERARRFIHAMLSEVPRKNSWQVAEQAREATPYGMQRLLAEAVWNENGVRDEVRRLVVETLGRTHAILALDETSFPKRGEQSAGVARQYCGTTGRVENCQVGVLLSWITSRGHSLIDRELYLPTSWTSDPTRCQKAGIPAHVAFRTKPELALHMLIRLREAGLHPEWVVADSVYGGNAPLRDWLEEQGQAYVGMVACTEPIVLTLPDGAVRRIEVGDLPALLPASLSWSRLASSTGPKGPRTFDWLCLPIWHQGQEDGRHFVLLRRCLDDPTHITAALVFAPRPTSLPHLVAVGGSRWHIEEDFANGKHLGMDHYEVRGYQAWYRFLTLVLFVLAALLCLRLADEAAAALSLREQQHVLARTLYLLPSGCAAVFAWLAWRRRHGERAARFHLRRRLKAG